MLPAAGVRAQAPAAPEEASRFAAVDTHASEHVAIAADPYDTPAKAKLFHIDYPAYHVLPIRIIVTNNGDTPISLADARIDFITAAGDKISAAEPEDVERILDKPGDPAKAVRVGPIKVGGKGKSKDKEIKEDFDTHEYGALAVEPHTTRTGFLFYDVGSTGDPLRGGRLELRRLRAADGKELFAFEVPFDKYLATK
ncbi:MAG: hypothetical protein ACR2JE_07295 [Acidobacteriaceae bacterium]